MLTYISQNIREKLDHIDVEKCMVIFRGFPLELLKDIYSYYEEDSTWILPNNGLSEDGRIEIERITSGEYRTKLKQELYSPVKRIFLTAEEASLLDDGDFIYSGRSVFLVNNDIVDEYPNETTSEILIDTEDELETFKKSEYPLNWELLYAETVTIGSLILVRPQTPTLPDSSVYIDLSTIVERRNISDFLFTDSEVPAEEEVANRDDLELFIISLLYGTDVRDRYPSVSQALIDDVTTGASWKLGVVSEIAGMAGYEIRYVIQSTQFAGDIAEEQIRPEINEYVEELWHGKFRNIEFYKMPEYSRETVLVNQGVIVERIITNVEDALAGVGYSDVFITAPTGAGKSLLFQLPAIYLERKHHALTIVVSPLKALMLDQVRQLQEKGISSVEFLNSDKSHLEREDILGRVHSGDVSILYLSPELLLSYDIGYFLGEKRQLALMVVDEAHLITTWGRDFRVDYWYLGTYLKKLRNRIKFPVVCLTATAVYGGDDDTVFDTIETLDLKAPEKFIGIARRTNIKFNIQSFIKDKQYADEKVQLIENRIRQHALNGDKTLVYCPYKSQINQLYGALQHDDTVKDKIARYYSGLDKYEKLQDETAFKSGEKPVLIATKAFGMGVDISDIEYVYHYAPNGTVADYVQEIGRAARDPEMTGIAETDYGEKDLSYAKTLFGLSSIKKYQLDLVMKKLLERYDQKKKQNMLFSVADFSYIFSKDAKEDKGGQEGDLNQKVLSTLMLIEKDFLRRYRYNVVIARPKALFTEVFACVDQKYDSIFMAKYGKYAKPIVERVSNIRTQSDRMGRQVNTSDIGNIYKIDLGLLWEEEFSDESFPSIKYKFYSMKLFGDDLSEHIYPRYNLAVALKDSVSQSRSKFEDKLTTIANILSRDDFTGRFFAQKELAAAFRKEKVTRDGDSLAALLCNLYSDQGTMGYSRTAVLQERKVAGIPKYQVISKTVFRLHSEMLRSYAEMFSQHSVYSKYLNVEKTSLARNLHVRCAYFLEALELGSYEFSGGNNPQTFVRINDVRHLRQTINNVNYKNVLWLNVKDRHKRSMALLNYFFTTKMSDDERWEFIERYFLGQVELDELVENIGINNDDNED